MAHLKAMADDKGSPNMPSSLLPWVLGGDFIHYLSGTHVISGTVQGISDTPGFLV